VGGPFPPPPPKHDRVLSPPKRTQGVWFPLLVPGSQKTQTKKPTNGHPEGGGGFGVFFHNHRSKTPPTGPKTPPPFTKKTHPPGDQPGGVGEKVPPKTPQHYRPSPNKKKGPPFLTESTPHPRRTGTQNVKNHPPQRSLKKKKKKMVKQEPSPNPKKPTPKNPQQGPTLFWKKLQTATPFKTHKSQNQPPTNPFSPVKDNKKKEKKTPSSTRVLFFLHA